MIKNILLIVLLGIFLLSVGCAPPKFITKEPFQAKFEPTPPYELDLSKIPKPDKLKPMFMNEKFEEVPIDQAKFIVLDPKEFAKIAALIKLAKAYKNIAEEQASLINIRIELINALKEYLAIEQAKANEYRQLWADSENAYRQERYSHKFDNLLNKGVFGAIGIGAIMALILAL